MVSELDQPVVARAMAPDGLSQAQRHRRYRKVAAFRKGKIAGLRMCSPPGVFTLSKSANLDQLFAQSSNGDSMAEMSTPHADDSSNFVLDSTYLVAAVHNLCGQHSFHVGSTEVGEVISLAKHLGLEEAFDVEITRHQKYETQASVNAMEGGTLDIESLIEATSRDAQNRLDEFSRQMELKLDRSLSSMQEAAMEKMEMMAQSLVPRVEQLEQSAADKKKQCSDESRGILPTGTLPCSDHGVDDPSSIPVPECSSDFEELATEWPHHGIEPESRCTMKPGNENEAQVAVLPSVPIVQFLRMVNFARSHVPHVSCTVRETFWITSRVPLAICDKADSLFSDLRRGSPVRLVGMVGAPHFNGLKGVIHCKSVRNGQWYVRVHLPGFPRPFGNEWMNLPAENVEQYEGED